jgi:hypothetical protein
MNQWSFVLAAYVLAAFATLGLIGWSWASMRSAEAEADAARRKR